MALAETVTLSRKTKRVEEIDWKLVHKMKLSFEDIKHGRIVEIKSKYEISS